MEGTDSEAVFDSLNLNPQLFINEVFNTVDDLVDEAFNYYLEQASSTLRTDGTDRAEDLSKGVALIRKMIQSVLDKRLVMWEEYCFNHCFEVPEGFSLPKSDEPPSNSSVLQDALYDPNLDAQLDSLRNKLTTVGKESAVLNRELRALEKQSVASGNFAALINETLQSYKDNSFDQMFHEMTRIASELKIKMGKLQTKTMEETRQRKTERLHALNRDSFRLDFSNGIADVKLEDLQGFLAKMKNV
ncbi:protein MIS12 homolog isoform X2 [Morus notabilis]|uniref:protein MIS12 homolog isoform X2 n=1 Tax=Morus notabilis TaxID=981085 RepID=UPI000CED11CB|nr:protein MIS12 homolog isoform X2 [Morus notabilis]